MATSPTAPLTNSTWIDAAAKLLAQHHTSSIAFKWACELAEAHGPNGDLQKLTPYEGVELLMRNGGGQAKSLGPQEMAKLVAKMKGEPDIKKVVRLEPCGDRYRYLIETPFSTFPKFVIGTTDADFEDVRIESRCGLLSTAEEAWNRRTGR